MENQTELAPWVIPTIFLPAFAAMWLLVNFVLYKVSWTKLQERFREDEKINNERIGIISMRFRWINYNNMITAYATPHGLYLKPILFFRLFHKPVLIPWKEIRAIREERIMMTRFVNVEVGSEDPQVIKFTNRSFKRMQKAFDTYTQVI